MASKLCLELFFNRKKKKISGPEVEVEETSPSVPSQLENHLYGFLYLIQELQCWDMYVPLSRSRRSLRESSQPINISVPFS